MADTNPTGAGAAERLTTADQDDRDQAAVLRHVPAGREGRPDGAGCSDEQFKERLRKVHEEDRDVLKDLGIED